ncbi:hypothetical protein Pmani_001765 [Petrolisthes manimaculis]|uniref:C-type lectin domain-containing protein n=1 Tax=Petrolisthes manimaculis TaxID=1843537 RepID=A0AAE1UL33_9EUCA|nr:hypothetical protein Pmani_022886 [Petrolisthes manimaculis]KAK4327782.1 hypothetical protein Pmani_001765 [Petrolisthes manimaculis]
MSVLMLMLMLLVLLMKAVENMKLMKFVNSSFDHCLSTDHVQRTISGVKLKEGFVRKNGIGYRLMQYSVTYSVARQACWNLGTNMSLPKNEKESQYIREIGNGVNVWALADDDPHEGIWKNTDTDEVLTYVNWATPEPNGGTGENCVRVDTLFINNWIDISCSHAYWYICQYRL